MPAAIVKQASQCLKTAFLLAIDKIGNDADLETLKKIRSSLEDGLEFKDLLESLKSADADIPADELEHVFRDWFSPRGFWPRSSAEKVVREGLVQAIDLQLENADDAQPMAVDYWWMPNTPKFAFSILLGPAQVTGIISTPPIPKRRGRQRQPRAAAGTTRKKAPAKGRATKKKARR